MYTIKKAEYMCSAAWESQWPDASLPEILLAGRSNVGKSSFINAMTAINNLAKVSSKPGKTRTLNFFNINDELRFVDVPGYGYANVSEKQIEAFGKMFETYVEKRENLAGMILLVDDRHPPKEDDITMYEYAKYYELPVIVIATKEDKLKRNERKKHLQRIINDLNKDPQDPIIPFSIYSNDAIARSWQAIIDLIRG